MASARVPSGFERGFKLPLRFGTEDVDFKAEAARGIFNGFELALVRDRVPEHGDAAQSRDKFL